MLSFFSITQNFGIWCNFFFFCCPASPLNFDKMTERRFLFEILLNLKTKFWLQHCREGNASSASNSETFPLMESSESSRLLLFPPILRYRLYWLFSGRKLGELIPLIPLPSIGKNEEEAFLDLLSFLVISLYISCVSQRREKNCRSSSRPKKLIGKSKLRREKSKEKQLLRIQSSSQHNGGKIK